MAPARVVEESLKALPGGSGPEAFTRFRRRLQWLIGALAAMIVAINVATVLNDRHETMRDAHNHAHSLALALDEHAARTVGEIDQMLFRLGTHIARQNAASLPLGSSLDPALASASRLPQLRAVFVIDRAGKAIVGGDLPEATAAKALAADLRAKPVSKDLQIHAPIRVPGTSNWLAFVSRTATDASGTNLGTALALLEPDYFNRFYQSLGLGAHGLIAVISEAGDVLLRVPYVEGAIGSNVSRRPLFLEHLPISPIGSFEVATAADSVPRVQAYRHLADLPLVVVVGTSVDEAQQKWRDSAIKQGVYLAGIVILIGAFTNLLLRHLGHLQANEQRFRTLVELLPDAIIVHLDGLILFANKAAEQVFRVPEGDSLIGTDLRDLAYPDDRDAMSLRLEREEGLGSLIEGRYIRRDGEAFSAEVMAAKIRINGTIAREEVIRDITERKHLQSQLVQSAKLATLGEMAAGMAHELSQPLNIMRMASESAMMMIDKGDATTAYQRGKFGLIYDQTHRMAEIIDHIRIFSRKDNDAVEVFDANAIAAMAVSLIGKQTMSEDIWIDLTLPTEASPVTGRPVQLEQVIINLLANAADSIRQRRKTDGASGRITVTLERQDDDLHITVADNGTGIDDSAAERLFEPFFTTKEVGRGTGLGLSVSFGIINSMSGTLTAENAEAGARFVIVLPLARESLTAALSPPPASSVRPAPPAGRGLSVLVVEDEGEARLAIAEYLVGAGYRVAVARSGSEAYRRFLADPADVVITDSRMPNGDGKTLIEQLRCCDRDLPIILITGDVGITEPVFTNLDDRCILLKKPLSLADLGEAMQALMKQST